MWWFLSQDSIDLQKLCLVPVSQIAFESARALLCSAPNLAAPSFTQPFKLEIDACVCGAGAVPLQEDEKATDHFMCYFSKKFNEH